MRNFFRRFRPDGEPDQPESPLRRCAPPARGHPATLLSQEGGPSASDRAPVRASNTRPSRQPNPPTSRPERRTAQNEQHRRRTRQVYLINPEGDGTVQPFTVHRPNNRQDRGLELSQGAPREPPQGGALRERATRGLLVAWQPPARAFRRPQGVDAVQILEARQEALRYVTGGLVEQLRSGGRDIPLRHITDALESCYKYFDCELERRSPPPPYSRAESPPPPPFPSDENGTADPEQTNEAQQAQTFESSDSNPSTTTAPGSNSSLILTPAVTVYSLEPSLSFIDVSTHQGLEPVQSRSYGERSELPRETLAEKTAPVTVKFKGKGPALDPADFVSEEEWNKMDVCGPFANLSDLNIQPPLPLATDLMGEGEATNVGPSSPRLTFTPEASDTHGLNPNAHAFRPSRLGVDREEQSILDAQAEDFVPTYFHTQVSAMYETFPAVDEWGNVSFDSFYSQPDHELPSIQPGPWNAWDLQGEQGNAGSFSGPSWSYEAPEQSFPSPEPYEIECPGCLECSPWLESWEMAMHAVGSGGGMTDSASSTSNEDETKPPEDPNRLRLADAARRSCSLDDETEHLVAADVNEQDHSLPTTADQARISDSRGDSTSADQEVGSDNNPGDEGYHDDRSNDESESQSSSSDSSSADDESDFVDHFGGFSDAFSQARIVLSGSDSGSSSSSDMDGRVQPFTEEGENLLSQLRHRFSMPDDMPPAAMATFFGHNPDLLRALFMGRISHPRWQFWDADNLYELHTDPADEADNFRAVRCFQKLQWVDHDIIYILTVIRAYSVPDPDSATRLVMEKFYLKRFRGKESPFVARRLLASGDAQQQAALRNWQQGVAKREKRPGSLLRREVQPEEVV